MYWKLVTYCVFLLSLTAHSQEKSKDSLKGESNVSVQIQTKYTNGMIVPLPNSIGGFYGNRRNLLGISYSTVLRNNYYRNFEFHQLNLSYRIYPNLDDDNIIRLFFDSEIFIGLVYKENRNSYFLFENNEFIEHSDLVSLDESKYCGVALRFGNEFHLYKGIYLYFAIGGNYRFYRQIIADSKKYYSIDNNFYFGLDALIGLRWQF